MGIYKTYREAVLASGSISGVYSDGARFFAGGAESVYYDIKECHPADHLETLDSFLASGKLIKSGDIIISSDGNAMLIKLPSFVNHPDENNHQRFVLQAAADQVETPEEKEAFDAIDTTPQQVESLSGSEKPNKSEWSGEELTPDDENCVYTELRHIGDRIHNISCSIMDEELQLVLGDISSKLWGIEAPAEREDRERDEMAKQLMIDIHGKRIFDKQDWNYQKKYSLSAQQAFHIIDKGYRKQ